MSDDLKISIVLLKDNPYWRRCERCWQYKYKELISPAGAQFPGICQRCTDAVQIWYNEQLALGNDPMSILRGDIK